MCTKNLETAIQSFLKENTPLAFRLLKELCLIPAPSHKEHKRAEFCKDFLLSVGAEGVYIDDALNVVYPVNCDGKNNLTAICAHTDTVFPDEEPMPYREDDEYIYSPGVGDNTVSVVMLLLLAKFITEQKLSPKSGLLLVFNSCEEGLGNLKGTRRLFDDFAGRIANFITLDTNLNSVSDRTAGSHRYEVEVKTKGGHSYLSFGNPNALAVLSGIVSEIYKIEVPVKDGCRTTYNVGTMSGGTSVNTICQSAKMLCEYRSNDKECLSIMQEHFERIFTAAKGEDIDITVSKIGDRPCSDVDVSKVEALKSRVIPVIESVINEPVICKCSSTDCNIPMSIGVPGINIGVTMGCGAHTREERITKASVPVGLEVALRTGIKLMEE